MAPTRGDDQYGICVTLSSAPEGDFMIVLDLVECKRNSSDHGTGEFLSREPSARFLRCGRVTSGVRLVAVVLVLVVRGWRLAGLRMTAKQDSFLSTCDGSFRHPSPDFLRELRYSTHRKLFVCLRL